MDRDHDHIDGLLAGYVLRALSGEDAVRADRLLAEHVPACPRCQRTLVELQELTGELALAARPAPPPDPLLRRIRHEIARVPASDRPPRRAVVLALAASIVALAVMSGISLAFGNRASEAEAQRGTALEILSLMSSPGASPVELRPQDAAAGGTTFVEVSAPDVRRIHLAARSCPEPSADHAYQLWLGSDGTFVPVGEMFRPVDGVVLLTLAVDISRYDEIRITEERAGDPPARPSSGGRSWRAEL